MLGRLFFFLTPQLLLGGTVALIAIVTLRNLFWSTRKEKDRIASFSHVIISENKPDTETPIYRSRLAAEELVDRFPERPNAATLYDNFIETVNSHKNRPFLGTRTDGNPFQWQTYGEILTRVTNIGSGLVNHYTEPGKMIGILSRNRPEWIIVEQACNAYSFICCPLYQMFTEDVISHIITQLKLEIIFVDGSVIQKLLDAYKLRENHLTTIISFDRVSDEIKQQIVDTGKLNLVLFEEIEKQGSSNQQDHVPPAPDALATICYTSGTTGMPKGVMLTHANMIADGAGCMASGIIELFADDVHLSYLPLEHVFERLVVLVIIAAGARVGFFRGDIRKHLFEDIQELKPTIFPSVPKLFSRIYAKVMSNINEYPSWKKQLFQTAFNAKKRRLVYEGTYHHYFWDKLVFSKIQKILGGRVRVMITGSAPISPEVLEFMRICFSCEVYEGYGQTECTAACCASIPGTFTTNNVGAPLPCAEIKLIDVPEKHYFATDQPNPRGEICIRGPCVFQGYFELPEETKKKIDDDGWLHTGDVGEWLCDGTLRIIDRKKNIFKIAIGEYVAPEKIENVLLRSKYVQMIFVYGERLKSSLVAIVVPDQEAVQDWAKNTQYENSDLETICLSEDLKSEVLQDLNFVGREIGLKGFEIPRAIHLEPKPFSTESGIVTPTLKMKREKAKQYYQLILDELYQSILE